MVFSTEEGKWKAVLREVAHMHDTGRPVLVGTTSVERSEYLADLLSDKGIKFQVHTPQPLSQTTSAPGAVQTCPLMQASSSTCTFWPDCIHSNFFGVSEILNSKTVSSLARLRILAGKDT